MFLTHLSIQGSLYQHLNQIFSQVLPILKVTSSLLITYLDLADVVSEIKADFSKPHFDLRVGGVQFNKVAIHIEFSTNLKF